MITPFDIEGGLALALARAASVAGLAAAAGSLVHAAWTRPPGLDAAAAARLRRVGAWSLLAALAGLLLWLVVQTQTLAGELSPDALRAVAGMQFGRLLLARLALLLLAGACLARHWLRAAALLGSLALLLQAGHSHALAMGGSPLLLVCAALHVLAAGLWLGGLPALLVLVAGNDSGEIAREAASRYSRLGLACVAALLASASVQASVLVGSLPGLAGTAYGWVIAAKAVLFAALLALAARNRLHLTPRLPAPGARRALGRAIAAELLFGVAVLALAGVLTELPPAMHTEALWPFHSKPSLTALREDPDVAREVIAASVALGLALALAATGAWLGWRGGGRRPALLAGLTAAALAVWARPHLSPLFLPAVPTEFYHSPTRFAAASIVAGQAEYARLCVSCHGAGGRGDGPAAHSLPVPPADLTAAHLWMHSDGQMFWWLTHGIEAPRGGLAMPGFLGLSDGERWALIDFVRARNAGLTLGRQGWGTPVEAPDFALDCPPGGNGGGPPDLRALRGQAVSVTLREPVTVRAEGKSAPCTAAESVVAAAYAIVAPGAGTVLIDAAGWLRAASPPGAPPPDPALAAAALKRAAPPAMDMPAGMKM